MIFQGESVEQVGPEANAEFLAGFLQAGEGIAGTAAVVGAGRAGDFAFDEEFTDVAFAQVVVWGLMNPLISDVREDFGKGRLFEKHFAETLDQRS